MIKNISFKSFSYDFDKIVPLNNKFVLELCASCFGGFCEQFPCGTGRRIDLLDNQVEISVNTHAILGKNFFNFTRCYTKYKIDTTDVDKKQDIVKYAKQLNKQIEKGEYKDTLPLFLYFNESINFENDRLDFDDKVILKDRSAGYNNCLLYKNHFKPSVDFFVFGQLKTIFEKNLKDSLFLKNFNKAKKILKSFINKLGYDTIFYKLQDQKLMVVKNGKQLNLQFLNLTNKTLISIMFDIIMRTLILNHQYQNPFENTIGTICIGYNFNEKKINFLINQINKVLPNVQLIYFC